MAPYIDTWHTPNCDFLKRTKTIGGNEEFIDSAIASNLDPEARHQGYAFYFREGLCWSDISDTRIRCRIKKKGVYDVKSMSIFSVTNIPDEYFVCIINSKLMGNYIKSFINNTVSFQINDARQLPIVIPDKLQKDESIGFVKNAIESKRQSDCDNDIINCIQEEVDSYVELLYNLGR